MCVNLEGVAGSRGTGEGVEGLARVLGTGEGVEGLPIRIAHK